MRNRRILNHRHIIAVFLQDFVNAFPPGSVHETAVDENNILHCSRWGGLCDNAFSEAEHEWDDRQQSQNDAVHRCYPKINISRAFHNEHLKLCERRPAFAGYPAESGSGGALFAETPNRLGADENSLTSNAKVKLQLL